MIVEFERHLRGTNLAENTVKSYLFAVRQFYTRYDSVTKRSLKEQKRIVQEVQTIQSLISSL